MRRAIFLILVFTAFAADFIFAQEVKLTTIVPDQTVVRGEKGAIGDTYKNEATGNIPANGLIVEGNLGIGTKLPNPPNAKLHVSGTAGTDGIKFPDGTLQKAAFRVLKSAQVEGTTNITNTTGQWQDMADMSITLETTTGKVLLLFSAWFYNASEMTFDVRIKIDNTGYSHTIRERPGTGSDDAGITLQYLVTALSPGAHTFKVQWKDTHLTVGQNGGTESPRVFTAVELP